MNNKKSPVPVMGCLAYNWGKLNIYTPAVILNPDASTPDMLAWCWGEMVAIKAAMDALAATDGEISKFQFDVLVSHRLDPVTDVLEHIVGLHFIDANLRAKTHKENSQNGGAS